MELKTPRLLLRPLSEEDVDDITRICQDPELYENTLNLPWPYTREDARNWLVGIEEAKAENRAGYDFAICLKDTGDFIGVIGLTRLNRHDDTEVGYWMDRNFWGQGLMTEAVKKVIGFAFAHGAHRVSGRHFTWNPASGRVMVKAGMKYEGVERESLKKDGKYLDDVCYGILDREFNTL